MQYNKEAMIKKDNITMLYLFIYTFFLIYSLTNSFVYLFKHAISDFSSFDLKKGSNQGYLYSLKIK